MMMMMKLMFTPHRPRLAPQLSFWHLRSHHELADLERVPAGLTAPFSGTIHTISAPLHFSRIFPPNPRDSAFPKTWGCSRLLPALTSSP